MSPVTAQGHQRLLPATLEARLMGLLARGGGLVLLCAVALAWTSLISWSVTDPSLTHATGGAAKNTLGPAGAIVADLLVETLGLASAIALLSPMFLALELTMTERARDVGNKIALYPLVVLTTAAALSALPVPGSWPLAHGLGGILGDVLFNFTSTLFSVLSHERAGLATGVLFALIALPLTGQCLGISAKDHFRRTARDIRREPEMSGARPQADANDPANGMWSERPWSPAAAPAWTDQARNPGHMVEPAFDSPAQPAYADHAHAAPPAQHAPMAQPYQAAAAPYHDHEHATDTLDPADDLGPLDPAIEHSSRAIAERFAPRQKSHRLPFAAGHPLAMARTVAEAFAAHFPHGQRAPHSQHGQPAPVDMAAGTPLPAPLPEATAEPIPFAAPQIAHPPRAKAAGAKPSLARNIAERRDPIYKRPQTSLLKKLTIAKPAPEHAQTALRGTARLLEDVLSDFGVKGEVRDIRPGPVVTLFELEPARGTKASRIIALADDIARSMSAKSARVAPIPGRNAIGIELPNARRDMVGLRELLESPAFAAPETALPLTLGRAIGGEPVVADLARMPHLLVAGTTGSGKSVGVNAMILSILYRHTPEDCRFLMIDPKMLELSVYNGIPHLLAPVVTEPQKAVSALNWAVNEMEERYKRMSRLSVRNIEAFNARVKGAKARGEPLGRTVQTGFDPKTGQPVFEHETMTLDAMPYIVIVVDEFADLMITAGKDIETAVQRLAQKARAAGIHLIMATQRPSVDIITGTIKANFPTRISFKVTSKIDSRTILNEQGAEQLLGQGDMLFAAGSGQTVRVHGPFVSDEEVEAIAAYLRTQGEPRYIDVFGTERACDEPETPASEDGHDSLYDRAVATVLRDRKASTSYLQRRLSIGYNRAADLIERMEREGLISAQNATGRREILADGTPHLAESA